MQTPSLARNVPAASARDVRSLGRFSGDREAALWETDHAEWAGGIILPEINQLSPSDLG